MSQKVNRIKPRAHYMLFAANTPFKQKVVKRKDTYQRHSKHKKSVEI